MVAAKLEEGYSHRSVHFEVFRIEGNSLGIENMYSYIIKDTVNPGYYKST
jgi:hypothetical protein